MDCKTKQDGLRKACLVVNGFQADSHYNIYSPVAGISTIYKVII